jgi:hypothetical protein
LKVAESGALADRANELSRLLRARTQRLRRRPSVV